MISKDKTYRTRDGREVRIYATDGGGASPVHGAYYTERSGWCSWLWSANGKATSDDEPNCIDLIEVKPRINRTVWLNLFPDHTEIFPTEEIAKHWAAMPIPFEHEQPISCVKVEIDVEEGEGL
jgi:hypothetical protein